MTGLLRYDAAVAAIAEAKSFDEVSNWVDKAAAVREYARRARNRQLEIDAVEIRIRAERRRGELLRELRAAGLLRTGPKKDSRSETTNPDEVRLEDLNTTRDESSRSQKLAGYDGNAFERLVDRWRAYQEREAERVSANILKVPDGPIKGARAIMGSRIEPDDSLDYFPTPPWATRALCELVLPSIGIRRLDLIWEPACGEGHMAEVLAEYGRTSASDIHDHGYGDVADFLACEASEPLADWIFTNPPFKKKTEAFLFQALKLARRGVALFVRMQWLETQGRYERIYSVNPPTLVAFFSERVPLCKGEWKPDGDTATAYIWLVWVKGMQPQPPFWIPPDCRDKLTKPDDAERFTQHPVVKLDRVYCDEPFDQSTGEITTTGFIEDSAHSAPESSDSEMASPPPESSPSPAAPMIADTPAQTQCEPETTQEPSEEFDLDKGMPEFLRRQKTEGTEQVGV